ncbi:inorganic phosphate transporter [Paracoccus benzoatiresistens]|uniref:Phosphate transporter n=1 Tax=Paracoccus benzoatiresistens TaxID=2997341 RepID=A0ABT4J7C1_9RHOB|nr:inorganic phosphate transporter [Paracoccus sp. EF6]MCZ0963025.1 inorganic phosphate transporter [Paracoccus sp. EF6]
MNRPDRQFRTLDKDLGRITVVESAQFHAIRPVLRLGAAILLAVSLIFLALGVTGQQPGLVAIGVGFIVAGWLGLSIGANDIANSLGPAVGAGAIAIGPGLALVALAEIAGAMLAGHAVTHRLAEGIVDTAVLSGAGGQIVMLAALIAAAGWITVATGANLPVSTSHSIVGAIAGAGLAAAGPQAMSWGGIAAMALAWILTPFAAAVLAGALLVLLRLKVAEAPDRGRAARIWLPPLIGAMVGLFVAYVATLLPALSLRLPLALLPGAVAGLTTACLMRRRVDQLLAQLAGGKLGMKRLLRQPLLFAAVMMAFAHGAGDAGNVAAPLLVILTPAQPGTLPVPLLLLAIAGTTIALGAVLFGRRLVGMVGEGITRLNPARAFCITLATAMIVLVASGWGLPVSSTHVAVGGVFGVGFVREMLDRRTDARRTDLPVEERRRRQLIRRSHVATITAAWLVTVPVTALLGGLCCLAMLWLTGL